MRHGSNEPPRRPDADGKASFDAAWGDLLGQSDSAEPGGATKTWDDRARAAAVPRVVSGDAVVARDVSEVSGPRVAESSSTDLPTATLDDEGAEPDVAVAPEREDDRQMDAMMSGSWAMATRDVAVAMMPPAPAQRDLRESEAEMAALMGAELEARERAAAARAAADASATAKASDAAKASGDSTAAVTMRAAAAAAKPVDVTKAVEPPRRPSPVVREPRDASALPRVAVGAVDDDDDDARGRVLPLHAAARKRVAAPEPRRITSRTAALELGAKPKRASLGWAVVAGVGVAGAVWWFGAANDAATPELAASRTTIAEKPAVDPTPAPVEPTPAATHVDDDDAKSPTERGGTAPSVPVEPKPPVAVPRDADPRTAPPGTPPEIAATFARLPVSPADLPPVGGVGATGIHVDRIEMGAGYDKTGCKDVAREFSVSKLEEINVCLRVVHPREEEMMSIVWQKKDGSTARRGKIAVVSLHAYRTRAYLRLRAEYVGDWVVRIMSADGVELAEHAFSIVP